MNKYSVRIAYLLFLVAQEKKSKEENKDPKYPAKGTVQAKMGLIKDRNGMDLTYAKDIKKRWQEYTENCTKKIFTTQIITML